MEGSLLAAQEHAKHDHGIVDEREEDDDLCSMSPFSDDDDSSVDSSCLSTPASSDDGLLVDHEGHLIYDMSSLMAQLPLKRGLSRFYDGKSQSFTSLGSVKALEDLPKSERSSCKKQKQMSCCKCKSIFSSMHTGIHSRAITKGRMRTKPPRSASGSLMSSSALAAASTEIHQLR